MLLRNAKLARGCQNCRTFTHQMASLKCHAFLRPTLKRAAAPWGVGKGTDNISDYELALFPPQFHFSKDTIKEFIIVFQNETVVK